MFFALPKQQLILIAAQSLWESLQLSLSRLYGGHNGENMSS
jgi:hypothetical protein